METKSKCCCFPAVGTTGHPLSGAGVMWEVLATDSPSLLHLILNGAQMSYFFRGVGQGSTVSEEDGYLFYSGLTPMPRPWSLLSCPGSNFMFIKNHQDCAIQRRKGTSMYSILFAIGWEISQITMTIIRIILMITIAGGQTCVLTLVCENCHKILVSPSLSSSLFLPLPPPSLFPYSSWFSPE
jgi:hypothetical protein